MAHKLTHLFFLVSLLCVLAGVLSKEAHSNSNQNNNPNEHNKDNDKHMIEQNKKEENRNNHERQINEEKNKGEMNAELNISEDSLKKSSIEVDTNEKNVLPNKDLKQKILFENSFLDKIKKLFEHKAKIDPKELQLLKGSKIDLDKDELVNILINQIKEYKEKIKTLEKKKSRFNFISNAMIVLNVTLLTFLLFLGLAFFYIGRKHYKDDKGNKTYEYFECGEALGFYKDVPYVVKKLVKKPFRFMSDAIYESNQNKYIEDYLKSQQLKEPLTEKDIYYYQDQEVQTDLKSMKKSISKDTLHDEFVMTDMDRSTHSERSNLLSPETASFTTLGDSRSSSMPSLEELDDQVINPDDI